MQNSKTALDLTDANKIFHENQNYTTLHIFKLCFCHNEHKRKHCIYQMPNDGRSLKQNQLLK